MNEPLVEIRKQDLAALEKRSPLNSNELNTFVENEKTLLMIACEEDLVISVEFLLKQNGLETDKDNGQPNHHTALMLAINREHKKIVDLIIEKSDLKLSLRDLNRAFIYYAGEGDVARMQLCLKKGADINGIYLEHTALHEAVWKDQLEAVKFLLAQKELNPNALSRARRTAFVWAIIDEGGSNRSEILQAFVNRQQQFGDIDLTLNSYFEGTPLSAAIYRKDIELAERIIDLEGEKFKVQNHPEVLNLAARKDYHPLMQKMLSKDPSCIHLDCGGKKTEVEKIPNGYLQQEYNQHDSPINIERCNDLPLNWAVAKGHEKMVELLLAKGANPEKQNLEGVSAKALTERQDYKFPKIKALFSNGAASSPAFFKPALKQFDASTIPLEIGEFFDSAFELLLESLTELQNISDKNILLNLLQNREMNLREISGIARLIDDTLGSSFDVLCAAIQERWDDPAVSAHKQSLITNMAKHCLSNDASGIEIKTIIQALQKRAYALVGDFLKKQAVTELTEEEKSKLAALKSSTQQQDSTQEIIEEYLKKFENDEFKFKLPELYKVSQNSTGHVDHQLIAKLCENYSVANESWKKIYAVVGKTPTGRLRDESQTCNILKAIIYKESKGISWRDLPQKFPRFSSVYYHYRQWAKVLPEIHFLLMQDPVATKVSALEIGASRTQSGILVGGH